MRLLSDELHIGTSPEAPGSCWHGTQPVPRASANVSFVEARRPADASADRMYPAVDVVSLPVLSPLSGDHDRLGGQLSSGRMNSRPVATQRHPRRHPRNRAVRAEQWAPARGVDQRRATAHRRRAIRWPHRPSAGPALRLVGHPLVISRAPRRHRAANTPPTRAQYGVPSTTRGADLCPRDTRGRQLHRHTAG